jgi:hypothetical protein
MSGDDTGGGLWAVAGTEEELAGDGGREVDVDGAVMGCDRTGHSRCAWLCRASADGRR